MEGVIALIIIFVVWSILIGIVQWIHYGVRDGLNRFTEERYGHHALSEWRGILILLGYGLTLVLVGPHVEDTGLRQAFQRAGVPPLWGVIAYFGLLWAWVAWRSSIWVGLVFIPAVHIYVVLGLFLGFLRGLGTFCATVGQQGYLNKCSHCGAVSAGSATHCSGCNGRFMGC